MRILLKACLWLEAFHSNLCLLVQDHCDHVDGTNCNPQEGSVCTTPIKSKENPGKRLNPQYEKQPRHVLTLFKPSNVSCAGLVPDSPTFFSSSPFKVLSPQPPKFLKSLLPVKEENKAKKALEARPLLGQEVSRAESSSSIFSTMLSITHRHSALKPPIYMSPPHIKK